MYGWAETQAQRSMARSASRNEKSGHRGRRYSWEVAYVGTAAPAVRSSEARQRPGAAPENSPAFQRRRAILKGCLRHPRLDHATGIFAKHAVQSVHEKIRVRFRKNQRRPKLEHVVIRTIGPSENATVAEPVDNVAGLPPRRRSRLAIDDQIDAEEQAHPAHISDEWM